MDLKQELLQRLKDLQEIERIEAKEAWDSAFQVRQYEWDIKWLDKYTINVTRRYDEPTRTLFNALQDKYPLYTYVYLDKASLSWHGMRYLVVGNVIARDGGGYCVLKVGLGRQAWKELTVEELACLKDNRVPKSLKI